MNKYEFGGRKEIFSIFLHLNELHQSEGGKLEELCWVLFTDRLKEPIRFLDSDLVCYNK